MLLVTGLAFAGCQTAGPQGLIGPPGAVPALSAAPSKAEKRRTNEELGRLYDRHPDDKQTALAYAKGLRAMTEYAQAAAVLQRLAIKFPQDTEVLGAYGEALADAGRLREAAEVLARAHTPDRPNWSIPSAQGSVANRLGDHEQAQAYYAAALKIAPAQPFVLSNLGLSYALSKKLPQAEKTLKEAASQEEGDSRVRQNLALVLAHEGKFASAEEVARRDLSPKDAAANVAAVKRMIAQSNTWKQIPNAWKQIQALDAKPAAAGMPGLTDEASSE